VLDGPPISLAADGEGLVNPSGTSGLSERPPCGAVAVSGAGSRRLLRESPRNGCGAITLSHALASLQGRSASPGPRNQASLAALASDCPCLCPQARPWAGSRLPSARGWEGVEACPPRHGRVAGRTVARVAPRTNCIIDRAVNAAGMPMAQETTQERLAANSCAAAHQLRPDLVGSALVPLPGHSLYRRCKVPPHPQVASRGRREYLRSSEAEEIDALV